MNRRQFLAAASVGALALSPELSAQSAAPGSDAKQGAAPGPLLDSPPALQNPTADGVTVTWAVGAPAAGWVEYGPTPELGHRAVAASAGLATVSDRFLSARLTGLSDGAPVYYRVVAAPVNFRSAYKIERGDAVASAVCRYTPPPTASSDRASFAVLNDTHEIDATLRALTAALAQTPADVTVYNGDVFNDVRGDDQVVKYALRPGDAAYASERPLLFVPGNHDHRGLSARGLHRAFSYWPDQPALPRCFARRIGPVAMIGLDTGEDKPDHHPAFAGLAAFEPYREAQRDWLAGVLQRPEIAGAPYLVVFGHIPLFGETPDANGGDTLEGYGSYSRHSQQLWHPLLARAGAQLLVTGHTHRYRLDPAGPGRPYAQLTGGGPQLNRATIIRGQADRSGLEVTLSAPDGKSLGRWTFARRNV